MKIYQAAHVGHEFDGCVDVTKGFVVIAPSEQTARLLASEQNGDEGADFWLAPSKTRFDVIGTAARGQQAAVVLRDFHAG